MKVLYDHQMFSIQKYGGISRYFCELMKNLPLDFALSVLVSDNYYLQENRGFFGVKNVLPEADFKGKDTLLRLAASLNQRYSEYVLNKNRYDLFHPTFYNDYYFTRLKRPSVITVHDLIEFRYRSDNPRSNAVRPVMERVIKKADRVIAISENTKRDVMEFFGIREEKIDVIYHGYTLPGSLPAEDGFGRYMLFVGHRSGYKNFNACIEALAPLLKREDDLKLICVGQPFSPEEIAVAERLGVKNRIQVTQVDDHALNALYAHAQVFIYPSLYEGFGMPILEAFANNCPVCLSNTSCFPEIAGDAGMYFDPRDASSILQAVEKVLYQPQKAGQLRAAGSTRLQQFSWQKAARQTAKTYERTLA